MSKKDRTHSRILDVAAKMVRERGRAETSVDDVMGAAELTRGGFYAHFRDKGALLAEALEIAFAEAHRNLFGPDLPARGKAWLAHSTGRYLSRSHLESPGSGCAIPALGAEVARGESEERDVFTRNVRIFLGEIDSRLATAARPARGRAITTLALWVGAVTLARAVSDRKLADEILEACRRELS